MRVTPVRPERLSDKIVKQFLQMMHDGELVPGGKLPSETQLADDFGVSRGVIREAMTQLEAQGYIRRRPKDGTYIQEEAVEKFSKPVADAFKKATYMDLLDFRDSLETRMVECVIERATDEEIQELVESLETAESDEEQLSMDHYFHYKLAQASRNVFYMNFIDTYYDLIQEIAVFHKRDQARRDDILREHKEIAHAISRRNAAAARDAMAHHLRMVRRVEKDSRHED